MFKLNWHFFRQHSWGAYACLNTQICILGQRHIQVMVQSSCLNEDWIVLFYDRSVWKFKLNIKHFTQHFWASQTRSLTLKWIFGTAFLPIIWMSELIQKTISDVFEHQMHKLNLKHSKQHFGHDRSFNLKGNTQDSIWEMFELTNLLIIWSFNLKWNSVFEH